MSEQSKRWAGMRLEDRQAEEMAVESAQDKCRLVSSKGSAEREQQWPDRNMEHKLKHPRPLRHCTGLAAWQAQRTTREVQPTKQNKDETRDTTRQDTTRLE